MKTLIKNSKLVQLFDGRDKKTRLSHISNLVALARADGSMDSMELSLIFKIGIKSGLTHAEVERIFKRPDSIAFTPPVDYKERFEQLYDLLLVTKANDEIHKNELKLCRHIAKKLGFKEENADKIIAEIIDMIDKGIDVDTGFQQLMQLDEG